MTPIKSSIAACFISALLLAVSADAAILTVNSTADDGTGTCTTSKCTLRDAILSAADRDTIAFSLPANSAITLTNGALLIDKILTINGPGANLLTVQRSAAGGTPQFRIFQRTDPDTRRSVTISGLTIANGSLSGQSGGGISNAGALTITNSTISGNSASTSAGGIYNTGALTIINSTISGNSAFLGAGIVDNGGITTITNSAVSANSASGSGGGIYSSGALMITITNSTISVNSAGNEGGGIFRASGTVTARNSIIALNTSAKGPDVNGALTSQGFNLIGNNQDATITATTGDQIGTPASPIDPMLGPLQDNGGPTRTHALLAGSRAIDKGQSGGAATDQRGLPRPVDTPAIVNAGDGSDIGAYEVQPDQLVGCSEINLVVNSNNDGGAGSLRAVIANACGGSIITFAANVRGAINLSSGELSLNKNLTINGPGAKLLSVQRSPSAANFRIFNVAPASVNATISALTIANGNAPGTNGGGIYNNGGTLTVSNSTLSGNAAGSGAGGGGIFNNVGMVTITNSTLSGNSASFGGGGIDNFRGTVTISNSTFSGNTTNGGHGGGIYNSGDSTTGTVTVINSTISGNMASDSSLGIGLGGS